VKAEAEAWVDAARAEGVDPAALTAQPLA
jgi:hypothetical protein